MHDGEILVIMRLSGSGKSTFIRAISRLNDATSGEILLDGKDLLKVSEKELIELLTLRRGITGTGISRCSSRPLQ
jgi:glycine betaine/proline transport system ATP-binding protein